MRKIEIEIPFGLSEDQERLALIKQLGNKKLGPHSGKLLGTGITIQEPETQIVIKRVEKNKPLFTLTCSVCECTFEKEIGHKAYTNYGGRVRTLYYCSEECVALVINAFKPRIVKTRKQLASLY